jgi:Zn-dependent M16 (insulinase) family peptidase
MASIYPSKFLKPVPSLTLEDYETDNLTLDNSESEVSTESSPKDPKFIRHYTVVPGTLNTISETYFVPKHNPELAVFSSLLTNKGFTEFSNKKGADNVMKAEYNFQEGYLTLLSIKDREVMKTYTEFEKGINTILDRSYSEEDLIQAKISLAKETYKFIKPSILKNTTDAEKLEKIEFTLQCLDVKDQSIVEAGEKWVNEKLKKGESSQVIYGKTSDNLEMYVSQGWVVDRFAKGLSLQTKNY